MTVVIVHRDRPDACRRTVRAFRDQHCATRFIVVDNGSDEQNRAALRAWALQQPDVELLSLGVNCGFGPGANVGLQRWLDSPGLPGDAGTDWAFVAPHDALPAPDCLERLLAAAAKEPQAGLLCADVGDGRTPYIDPYFGGITMPGSAEEGWQPSDYPHGTLMGIRRRCAQEVGLFDERYFAYCEEADLALRARRHGWHCGLVRGARVTNSDLSSPLATVDYLQMRNTLFLVRRHSGRYHAAIRLLIGLAQLAADRARPTAGRPSSGAGARLAGMRDFLLGRNGPPPGPHRGRRPRASS